MKVSTTMKASPVVFFRCVSILAAVSFLGAEAPTTEAKRSFKPLVPPANFTPPIMEIDNPDFDWGTVLQGEPVRHSYKITNRGGAPLIITRVAASCGCTTAGKPEKPIEPGQSDFVVLEIDTKRFSGPVKKTADIYSNASATPTKISIGGKVETFFTIEPAAPRIEIVKGVPAAPVKVQLKRNANTSTRFTVKEVKTESKVLTVSIAEAQPGELYELTLSAALGEDARKYYYETVTIKLDVGGKPFDVPFYVSVTVKDRIDVLPRATVYFSALEMKPLSQSGGKAPVKTLDVKSLGGADHSFTIKSVVASPQTTATPASAATPAATAAPAATGPSLFDIQVETVEPGKHYRLNVSVPKLPADDKVRTVRERITVETDDPTIKQLVITAVAAVK